MGARDEAERRSRRKGLLIVPQFPSDSFWSYRYVMRLIGRKAAFPPLGVLTFAGYLPEHWDLEVVDLNVTAPSASALRSGPHCSAPATGPCCWTISRVRIVDVSSQTSRRLPVDSPRESASSIPGS